MLLALQTSSLPPISELMQHNYNPVLRFEHLFNYTPRSHIYLQRLVRTSSALESRAVKYPMIWIYSEDYPTWGDNVCNNDCAL